MVEPSKAHSNSMVARALHSVLYSPYGRLCAVLVQGYIERLRLLPPLDKSMLAARHYLTRAVVAVKQPSLKVACAWPAGYSVPQHT